MKYQIGEKVRVKKLSVGKTYGGLTFFSGMKKYIFRSLTITEYASSNVYKTETDYYFSEEMLMPIKRKENKEGLKITIGESSQEDIIDDN